MRARLITLLVLGFLIISSLGAYWYMAVLNTSFLTFSSNQESDFTVQVRGTLNYHLLPLADKLLVFEQACHTQCKISPLPPAEYTIELSSTGYMNQSSTFSLDTGSSGSILYTLRRYLVETQNSEEAEVIPSLPEGIAFVKHLSAIADIVVKKSDTEHTLGLFLNGEYRSMRNIADMDAQVNTDLSHEYILIQSQDVTNLVAKDFSREVEFPRSLGTPLIVTWYDGKWKVRLQSGVYEYNGQDWEKNIRFTDYIDLTPYDRLGYIDAGDSEHLSLGNLPLGQGVYIMLDRKTGESYVAKNNVNIQGFFYRNNTPYSIDREGHEYIIEQ